MTVGHVTSSIGACPFYYNAFNYFYLLLFWRLIAGRVDPMNHMQKGLTQTLNYAYKMS